MINIDHLTLHDSTMIMSSRRSGELVTITYRRGHESRAKAAVMARQYARDAWHRGIAPAPRAVFVASEIGEDRKGHTTVTYVYRLAKRDALLRSQLAEHVQNR